MFFYDERKKLGAGILHFKMVSGIKAPQAGCWEEYSGTAQMCLQMALDALRMWKEKWLMKVDAEKTTLTTFTLSTKFQTVRLEIGEYKLREEPFPTYLGVTFDKRLTWKA
ncbi:hypothetical protein ElyMa_004526600 [Elysia marginata]|uniref:Reverse transcriptase/retrotransposon-derived protein RNase H-like domain-containing protein n=1 Tax=Elysia marginata TaxID=1093978 RepID=A0AAV4HS09_9GAST|nr:hypothetical protein ElyMa_004526600 [Elysia marginata]